MKKLTRNILISLFLILIVSVLIYGATNVSKKICEPGYKNCSTNQVFTCSASGTAWVLTDTCQDQCTEGECKTSVCVLRSCLSLQQQCGNLDNGCGDNVECGSCDSNNVCSQGECVSQCVPGTCYSLNKKCGNWDDGCGNSISCGSCSSGLCVNGKCQATQTTLPKFSDSYETSRKVAGISDTYLSETWYYDYSNIYIDKSVKSMTPLDATKYIVKDVYQNIDYNTVYQTLSYCYNNQASQIIENGNGVCSTMSRVTIARLRGAGLAARSVSGCAKVFIGCLPMTYFQQINKAKQEGDRFVMGGGLHSWTEVWLPDTGWTIVESTSGFVYPSSCISYKVYAREPNFTTAVDECSVDRSYKNDCDNF